jgi:hypothetical protein
VPEPGGSVTFTVRIDNDSVSEDPVTVQSLTDDIYGDVTDAQNLAIESTTCSVGQAIAPGGFFQCSFTARVEGNADDVLTDTVTVTGVDDDSPAGTATAADSATVTVTGTAPSVVVTKTASPETVAEPDGSVTFTVAVENTSNAEDPVTIGSLTDSIYGDLTDTTNEGGPAKEQTGTTCTVQQTIPPQSTYSCTFTVDVSGNNGFSETNVVTASGTDDDEAPVTGSDTATVTVVDAAPSITVVKTASPEALPEPGGEVTFTVAVTNGSVLEDPVTLTSLVDDLHGSLNGQGDCSVPWEIAPQATESCNFTVEVSGNAGYEEIDTVTATGTDDDGTPVTGSDTATVTVTGTDPDISIVKTASPTTVPEPGGDVTFTVRIDNDSVSEDPVTIDTLTDDVYGDLTDISNEGGVAKAQLSTTCTLPQTIQPGLSYSCEFTARVEGNRGFSETDTVTASGRDDDEVPVAVSDAATVTVVGVDPVVRVTKTATPTSLAEPGGTVSFTVEVENASHEEDPVTMTSLVDSIHGTLDGKGTCSVPQPIEPGSSYSCAFTADLEGNSGEVETDVVTASGTDDESVTFSASDDASVTFTPTEPAISVTKTATPRLLVEPGGEVIFTVRIDNLSTSRDPVTITSLIDDVHGNLAGRGTCSVPRTIQPGGFSQCSFQASFNGNAADSETDTVAASGTDDDGAPVVDSDSATVEIVDGIPSIAVTKSPSTLTVPEPGGLVTFTVTVENTSSENDPVSLAALIDSVFGDLSNAANPAIVSTTCSLPQTIQPTESWSCAFEAQVSGNAGDVEENVVTASGTDDDGTAVSGSASAAVTVTGVTPAISVTKIATPASLPEPGGAVTFSLRVTNDSIASSDPVTLLTLLDSV